MIRTFAQRDGHLFPADLPAEGLDGLVWIDLVEPAPEEIARIQGALGIELPSRADMQEIEISARLYHEADATFMTANLTSQVDSDDPRIGPVTFVLAGEHLITIRYHAPTAFENFPLQAQKTDLGCTNGDGVMVGLLESIIARTADILERCGHDIDRIASEIFRHGGSRQARTRDLQDVLVDIGRVTGLNSSVHDSLVTLERVIGFLSQATAERKSDRDLRTRIKSLARDARSLGTHTGFLSDKSTFLLDATLGLINVEQNTIIKIFSVVAVVFLPPTLIASIYGMNFQYMPELAWPYAYPVVLAVMVVAAVLPYVYFKIRGWL